MEQSPPIHHHHHLQQYNHARERKKEEASVPKIPKFSELNSNFCRGGRGSDDGASWDDRGGEDGDGGGGSCVDRRGMLSQIQSTPRTPRFSN